MTPSLRTRATVAATGTALAVVSGLATPADAGPVASSYSCSSASLSGSLDLNLNLDTTAPAKMYVGRSVTPKLNLKATIPGNIVGLAAFFGVKSASATGTYTIKINGSPSARALTFPRTDIPQSSTDFPVKLVLSLPALTRSSTGTVTYKPGPVAVTLTGYKNFVADAQPGDDVGSVSASCTAKSPNQVIDTVTFVKSPTSTAVAASYAAKTVTGVAKVKAASGLTPTGSVTAALYKGSKKLKTRTATLSGGTATAHFTGVHKKGAYKVVFTYAGSKAMKGSSGKHGVTVG